MKYKEAMQVTTTVNEFLRFHNQYFVNYHEIRSHKRKFIIRSTDVVPSSRSLVFL